MPSRRNHPLSAAFVLAGALTLPSCYGPRTPASDVTSGSETSSSTSASSEITTAPESSGATASLEGTSTSAADGSSSGGEPSSSSSDDESSTGDSASCVGSEQAFGPPAQVTGIASTATEDRAWLSPDELTMYFSSDRKGGLGGFDVWVAHRELREAAFATVMLVDGANDAADQRFPALTADGLTLYTGDQAGTGDIYVATRDDAAAAFGASELMAVVNAPELDGQPWVSAGGETMYFNSARAGTQDIYRTTRMPDGSYGMPEEVGELSGPSADLSPVLSSDGLTVLLQSDRPGGVGSYDVWIASRSTTDDGFGTPENLAEVNSELNEAPTWISEDQCRLFLRARVDDVSAYDIWMSERAP